MPRLTLAFLFTTLVLNTAQAADIADCAAADFVSVEGPTAAVTFGGDRGYTPRCLKVKAGTRVTIAASGGHPFQAMADIDGLRNPFAEDGTTIDRVTRTLNEKGLIGYFCTRHGTPSGAGMAGVILVE